MSVVHLDHYPEVLEDLWAKISHDLTRRGLPRETADEAAFATTEYMRQGWGGRNHYTPKGRRRPEPVPAAGLFGDETSAPAEPIPPEYLRQLADQAAAILQAQGVAPDQAAELARAVADLVRSEWAGERIYVPKGVRYDLSRRDYSIWREWDGSYPSKLRLMQQHNITEQRFYQIVAAVRRREFKRVQPALPFAPEHEEASCR